MMNTYALCLIAATASAIHLGRRSQGTIDEACWYTGEPYTEANIQTYTIDADGTVLAQDILDTGAFHGYIHLGDEWWDRLNDDNMCEYADYHMECDGDQVTDHNAFYVDPWGLLAIFPALLDFDEG